MNPRLLFPAAIALLTLFAAPAFSQAPGGNPGGRVYVIRTGHPSRSSISQRLRITGGLYAPAEVDVSTKVTGRLLSLEREDGTRLEEGVKVRKGDRLAVLDSADYAASLAAASATVASAEATLKDKKREFERAATLFKEGTATEQERDQSEADYERAQAALDQAKAQETSARINLAETTLSSPMDGVVSARHVEPGALLTAGAKILTITQMDPVRFQANIPTTRFSDLQVGKTEVLVEVDAYPGMVVTGRLSRFYPVADSATRTFRIETLLANADGRYLPGMYATCTIALSTRENVLVIPYDAVVRNADRRIVYRVHDGVAEAVDVTLGIRDDAVVEVVAGLAEGDEIVLSGQHRLSDGAKVKLEEAE